MSKRRLLTTLLLTAACGGNTASPVLDARTSGHDSRSASVDAPTVVDAPAAGVDPAQNGPNTLATADVTIPLGNSRSTSATTFVPTSGPTPRPLVVISPGFQMARSQYTSYAHHLATWGMTVVLADYADQSFFANHQQLADDVTTIITWALAQSSLAVDPSKIATAGHSLGGKISILAAADDPRITAVIGWDPVDGGSAPTVVPDKMATMHAALAVIGETTDGSGSFACAPTANNYMTFYGAAGAGAPALAMTVIGADHMNWVDDPTCSLCTFCTAGTAPATLARTATLRLDVAWLRRQLFDDPTMTSWLTMPPEVAAGTATVESK